LEKYAQPIDARELAAQRDIALAIAGISSRPDNQGEGSWVNL